MALVRLQGEVSLEEAINDLEADLLIHHQAELQTRRTIWQSSPPTKIDVQQLTAHRNWNQEHRRAYTKLLSAIQQFAEINIGEPGYGSACDVWIIVGMFIGVSITQ